ncbi:hypothetical protein PR048_011523, partial [Dryococelus australis]
MPLPKDKVLTDYWHGKRDMKKLKVFGSKYWEVTLPRPNKLNPKSMCVRLDLEEDNFIQSRAVVFDEDDVILNKELFMTNEGNHQLVESDIEDNITPSTE